MQKQKKCPCITNAIEHEEDVIAIKKLASIYLKEEQDSEKKKKYQRLIDTKKNIFNR